MHANPYSPVVMEIQFTVVGVGTSTRDVCNEKYCRALSHNNDACHEKIDLFGVQKWAIFRSSNLCKIGSFRHSALNLVSK